MPETLMDGLASEIERCSKLIVLYNEIPAGAFSAIMIQRTIDKAKEAISSGDIAEMISSYRSLEDCR